MVVVEGLEYPNEVRRSPEKYKDMEDLMGAADYVKRSWLCLFGMLLRVHHCARNVEDCLQHEPSPPHLLVCLSKAELCESVCHR